MTSSISSGGTVTNYSPRFSIAGMTGTFPAPIQSALSSISSMNGPLRSLHAVGGSDASAKQVMDVAPALQGGPTLYESMQPLPPTRITRARATPQYSTSPYWIATTFLPPNSNMVTTVVQPGTWSFTPRENPVGFVSLSGLGLTNRA
jgi:hypothetical protein